MFTGRRREAAALAREAAAELPPGPTSCALLEAPELTTLYMGRRAARTARSRCSSHTAIPG